MRACVRACVYSRAFRQSRERPVRVDRSGVCGGTAHEDSTAMIPSFSFLFRRATYLANCAMLMLVKPGQNRSANGDMWVTQRIFDCSPFHVKLAIIAFSPSRRFQRSKLNTFRVWSPRMRRGARGNPFGRQRTSRAIFAERLSTLFLADGSDRPRDTRVAINAIEQSCVTFTCTRVRSSSRCAPVIDFFSSGNERRREGRWDERRIHFHTMESGGGCDRRGRSYLRRINLCREPYRG